MLSKPYLIQINTLHTAFIMISCAEEVGMFAFPQRILSTVVAQMSRWRRGRIMADHMTRAWRSRRQTNLIVWLGKLDF